MEIISASEFEQLRFLKKQGELREELKIYQPVRQQLGYCVLALETV